MPWGSRKAQISPKRKAATPGDPKRAMRGLTYTLIESSAESSEDADGNYSAELQDTRGQKHWLARCPRTLDTFLRPLIHAGLFVAMRIPDREGQRRALAPESLASDKAAVRRAFLRSSVEAPHRDPLLR